MYGYPPQPQQPSHAPPGQWPPRADASYGGGGAPPQPDYTSFYTPPMPPSHAPPHAMDGSFPPNEWSAPQQGAHARARPPPANNMAPQSSPYAAPPSSSNLINPSSTNSASLEQVFSNPVTGMMLDYGKGQLGKNLSFVMSFLSGLKYYFHVNHDYVLAKLKILLLPFMHKNWKRLRADENAAHSSMDESPAFLLPSHDINAPDLYIPTMAFITLIVVLGYCLGQFSQFHPEVLGMNASRNLILLFFEVLGLKLGLYLIQVPGSYTPKLFDLISYASYKYVHCICMLICGLVLGRFFFYCSILLFGACAGLFMMRTIKRVCTPIIEHSIRESNQRRNTFLLIVGGMQIIIAWILVRTGAPL